MKKLSLLMAALMAVCLSAMADEVLTVSSPDGHIRAEVKVLSSESLDRCMQWRVSHDNTVVLDWSPLSLDLRYVSDGKLLEEEIGHVKSMTGSCNRELKPQIYPKRNSIQEQYNWLKIYCSSLSIDWRVYNDGAAYRYTVNASELPTRVMSENVNFRFAGDYEAYIPYENDLRAGEHMCVSFESFYDKQRLSEMYKDSLSITPLCVNLPDGKRVLLTETGLQSYPGMFLKKGEGNSLIGTQACVPTEFMVGGASDYNLVPTRRTDYIAQWSDRKQHELPWRIVGIFADDKQILNSDLVYLLSPESVLDDVSWIKLGQSTWDWWNDWNLEGVDFEPGINNRTYEYYADFASRHGIPYLIVDDGWSTHGSLRDMISDLDIKRLVDYAAEKQVGVILWGSYRALMSDMEGQMDYYAKMGVKGFKIDFLDRDDQVIIDDLERMAHCAAAHHLILDLHGFKPTGIQRRWPNVVSFEGVKGLEVFKWEARKGKVTENDHPRNVMLATFIRGFSGPMDYTPGGMDNATYKSYKQDTHRPQTIGTRCNQLAMFVCMETPFQMLADSPTEYEKNSDNMACTELLSCIPTTYDETVVLDAKLGEYIVIARRKGSNWYLGAMTNEPRTITVDCSFLGQGYYTASLFSDCSKNKKDAKAYSRKSVDLTSKSQLKLKLEYAGGAAAIISHRVVTVKSIK
ncbi:MAG: glycoside hydrolase family 97 protein [Bacteroidales bacterium]|nr:glycoside hydrolase family 97 protein [Candidatus Colicola faecequi]